MKFSAKVTGADKIKAALNARLKVYDKKLKADLIEGILLIHSEAIKGIQKISSGAEQTRYGPKRQVKVSKPGDPPNTDTGTAIKSIGFNVDEVELIGEVGTSLLYLKFLEFGTKFVEARPWLITALKKVQPKLRRIFRTPPKAK